MLGNDPKKSHGLFNRARKLTAVLLVLALASAGFALVSVASPSKAWAASSTPTPNTWVTDGEGGDFTRVGGVARNRLAHIRSNGTLDTSWNPDVGGTVSALALSGGTIYAGGGFTTVGGNAQSNLARFD